jgi:hypothetical protein
MWGDDNATAISDRRRSSTNTGRIVPLVKGEQQADPMVTYDGA